MSNFFINIVFIYLTSYVVKNQTNIQGILFSYCNFLLKKFHLVLGLGHRLDQDHRRLRMSDLEAGRLFLGHRQIDKDRRRMADFESSPLHLALFHKSRNSFEV